MLHLRSSGKPYVWVLGKGIFVTLLILTVWFVRQYGCFVRERKQSQPLNPEQPRPVPVHLQWDDIPLQLPGDGVGLLFHRRYWADIAHPTMSAEAMIQRIKRDLRAFSPRKLAAFTKTKGSRTRMAVGDEYEIKMLGPWNGSVRVVEVTPTSFTFVTLKGHPEAGQICFRLQPHPDQPDTLRFEIMSWARSRDMLVSLAYHEGKVGKEVQKNAWVTFCERVVEASRGELLGEISVITEEREFVAEVIPHA